MNQPQTTPVGSNAPELKQAARDVKRAVQDNAQDTFESVRQGADRLIDQQKLAAGERIEQFGRSLSEAGQCVAEQNPQIGRMLDGTASRVAALGTYLRERDVNALLGEVNRFGREHPLVLLGGMFVAGALAARFLKASQERTGSSMLQDGDNEEPPFEELAEATSIPRDSLESGARYSQQRMDFNDAGGDRCELPDRENRESMQGDGT